MIFSVALVLIAILNISAGRIESHGIDHATDSSCSLSKWKLFKEKFTINYKDTAEDKERRSIFCENLRKINQFNSRNGTASSKLHVNSMSALSQDEIKQLLGKRPILKDNDNNNNENDNDRMGLFDLVDKDFLKYIDWTFDVPKKVFWGSDKRRVGPIRNQIYCGSCWAFTTAALLESRQWVQDKTLQRVIPLSPQQLIDCSTKNNGCQGGRTDKAFSYLLSVGGMSAEADYKYEMTQDKPAKRHVCRFNATVISSYTEKKSKLIKIPASEETLKRIVARYGPVGAAIEVNEPFVHAGNDVIFDDNCEKDKSIDTTNHEILIVGYGTDPAQGDYWIIKNSWGLGWGIDGYGRVARNRNNNCKIASYGLLVDDL